LRFNHPNLGLILIKSVGNKDHVLAIDEGLKNAKDHWFGNEVLAHLRRVLRRLDQTARSFFALIEPGSCFAGHLLEAALGSDRIYMLDDPDNPVDIQLSHLNFGELAMDNGPTRLEVRFYGEPDQVAKLKEVTDSIDTETAEELGLITFAPDDIDWEDDIRIAIEERVSYSPDALTGMEQNLRFVGQENMNTKIFGRLSAWQNWIFQRPNAVGPQGALTAYGKPERPSFNWTRT
ncbi:MAG: benzoyl-CoA-dihydrodiol lyase, partial [Planctomycetota bacterium]|nr:benzoyl-CoA-dihydrodiol lyase [Planctomycetota bacterium]